LQKHPAVIILVESNVSLKTTFFNPNTDPMTKQEFDLRPIPASKVLFRLALLGIVLLGCVYGFLVLFNSALEAMK
jgi:hypothetical protein